MSRLFSTFQLRSVHFRNRIFVSPMCQYSSDDGIPTAWHMVHLGSRAVGGAGLVMVEASAVSPEARISPGDSGMWSEQHAEAFKPITSFIKSTGCVPGIQLAHAGRKASTEAPWRGGGPIDVSSGGWQTMAPSALPFDGYPAPHEMTAVDIREAIGQFSEAAKFSMDAGFQVIELHMAHGYLMHQFLSPLSNHRNDDYGGNYDRRVRFPLEVARAVRGAIPDSFTVFVRISATDWVEGGWDLGQSVEFCRRLKDLGIDLIDCSSGGAAPGVKIPAGPGYQVPFAEAIRRDANVPTAAVGMISEAHQAEEIIAAGKADAVFLARAFLRDPYWPLHAAKQLKVDVPWPVQYLRAKD